MVGLCAQGGPLCRERIDLPSQFLCHLDPVVVSQLPDVLFCLLEIRLVRAVLDRVVDRSVRSSLARAQIEGMPLDGERFLAPVLVAVERRVTEIAKRADVVRIHRDRIGALVHTAVCIGERENTSLGAATRRHRPGASATSAAASDTASTASAPNTYVIGSIPNAPV